MADFPSVPFTTLNLTSNHPTIVTKSLSGLENRHQVASQYWSFTAEFQNITDAERRQLMGFLASKSGALNTFTIDLPGSFQDSSGTYAGSMSVVSGTAGGSAIQINFNTTSGTVIFKAGDLIKFSNHNKIYMITTDITALTTGSQNRVVGVYPALRTSTTSATITYNDVPMTVRCSTDMIGFASDANYYPTISLDFIEVL